MKNIKRITTAVLLFAGLFIATDVSAMCAHNRGEATVQVHFDCGNWCFNNWKIAPGGKECRPARPGKVRAHRIDEAHLECSIESGVHTDIIIKTPGKGNSASISCTH